MNEFARIVMLAAVVALTTPAFAQAPPADGQPPADADAKPAGDAGAEQAEPAAAEQPAASQLTITVIARHGTTGRPLADTPVFLRAARPRGPFEPTAPPAQFEWTEFTNAAGEAVFSVPKTLTASGLRVHAVATYDGIAFESAANAPVDRSRIKLDVYDKGLDTSVVAIQNLRSVIDVWEHYLVFTQYYTLTNEGETALDIKLLPDEEFEKGIPLVLPVKAQGINVTGPGENVVVNSTIYWKGVLKPGERVNLQVRFSMSARDEEFTYEQTMNYPTKNVEVVVPIQTRFEKVPRLDNLELRPPGFSETERGNGIFGLRDDIEFVGARGLELDADESFTFQLRGLPFHRPKTPWIFLGVGILMGLLIIVFGRREVERARTEQGKRDMKAGLQKERQVLLDELVALEQDFDEGIVTEREYEIEASALREQLALILARLSEIEGDEA